MSRDHMPPGFEHENKNLAIDFDGVIHQFDGWGDGTCYGDPIPGSLEAICELSQKYNLIIFTAKARRDRPLVNGQTGEELVRDWLIKHNVYQYIKTITSEKPRACLYIDDKAYRFVDWSSTLTYMKQNA
jgi:hypothetical protein